MTSQNKDSTYNATCFVVTGNFTKETLNNLLKEHKRNCINAMSGGICNDFCENTDLNQKLDDQSDYLIVGAVMSRQFDNQELDFKKEMKQCTNFDERSKVISEV